MRASFADVLPTGNGGKKIQTSKEVPPLTVCGFAKPGLSSKAVRRPVKEGVNKDEAEKIKKQIEEAGGTVELK